MSAARPPPAAWNVALWVAQVLLAGAFGMAGVMKMSMPIAELTEKLVWPGALPPGLVRFIGACELAGALGLIMPAAAGIRPMLTPLAAAGLATVMVFASVFHVARGEVRMLPVTLVLGTLAAFIAWGRARKAPIPAR